jgi:hypothetical protein
MRVPRSALERVRGRQILISMPPMDRIAPFVVETTVGAYAKFSLRVQNVRPGVLESFYQ